MLTARAQTEDRIVGLEAGADDYLTKPFSPKEMILRVHSVLRRAGNTPGTVELEFGPFRLDKNNMRFYMDGERVDLTATEFKLLLYLCERAGKAQNRHDLLRTIWGYSDEVHSRTLDTHMKRLRQKLGHRAGMVETIRGVGYRVEGPG
jgi:two-component system phosphate regulon response regulator PhoB